MSPPNTSKRTAAPRNRFLGYGIALAAGAAAVAMRALLDPWLGDSLPLVFVFGAIAVAAWVGGPRPALLVMIAGYLACNFLFIAPRGHLGFTGIGGLIGMLAYLATGTLILGFGAARREGERALARSEADLRDFFDNASVPLHWVGPDGVILRVNQAELDLLGYAREEYVGRPIAEFHVDRDVIDDMLARLAAGETLRGRPARMRCKDGSIRDVRIHSSVLFEEGRFLHTRCFTHDVTELIHGEQRERELTARALAATAKFEAVFQQSGIFEGVMDLEGNLREINGLAVEACGYTRDQVLDRPFWDTPWWRGSEEMRACIRAATRQALAGEVYREVLNYWVADGSERVVDFAMHPIRDPAGKVIFLHPTGIDITERLEAATAARNRAEQFESLLDAAPFGIFLVDADFKIAQVNPVALPIFGEAGGAAGVVGRDLTEILRAMLPAERAEELAELFRRTMDTGESFVDPELVAARRDRREAVERYYFRLDRITLPDGRPGVVCYFRDIGDQVLARQTLRNSEERYRLLTEAITSVVWTADPEGRFVTPQHPWLKYTGQTWEEARGYGWMDALHPDDRERIRALWTQAVHSSGPFHAEGRLWHTETRAYRRFEARGVPLRNEDGAIREWVGKYLDVEDRKRAEDALEDASRRKDEFLATLAHELRNPLAPISNALEVLKITTGDPAAFERTRSMMERQLGQMVRLIDDLFDVSRISRGKLELRRGPVELATVLQQAVETCRPMAEAAGHHVVVSLPAEPVHLHADPVRLTQVFTNLLHNACKFTDPGGHIAISARTSGDQVLVTVEDDGIGIPPDKLGEIFEMFVQVDQSLERSQGGLGLGLTLVHRLVRLHDGSVEAHSRGPGQGSSFVVRMPLAGIAPLHPERPDELLAPAGGKHRILVVDDNRDGAESLALLLRIAGNDTHVAHDGKEAVEAAGTLRPDVILLDIGLPKLSGYEACRRIRDEDWGRDIVIIALTGWGQDEDKRKSSAAGFDGHLVKPVDHAALTKLLRELLAVRLSPRPE